MSRPITIEQVPATAYTFARRYGARHHEAEDIAQDVAEQMLTRPPRDLDMSYVSRATKGTLVDRWRKSRREIPVGLPQEDVVEYDVESSAAAALHACLVQVADPAPLPWDEPIPELVLNVEAVLAACRPRERLALRALLEGNSTHEAGRRLGMSFEAVRALARRGAHRLKQKIADRDTETASSR